MFLNPVSSKSGKFKPCELEFSLWFKTLWVKPCDLKPCELKPCELKPGQLKPDQLKPCELKPCDLKPCDLKPGQIKPDQFKPYFKRVISNFVPLKNKFKLCYFVANPCVHLKR